MGQCSPLLSAGLHHRPSPPLPAKPCSLQGLATGRSTAIRLIWKYVTFLEKMSQNYRGERWKRFIKAASPSSCQSTAAPTHSRLCSSDVLEMPGDLLPAPALEGSSRALWWDTLCWLSGRHLDGLVASFQLMQPCFLPCQWGRQHADPLLQCLACH